MAFKEITHCRLSGSPTLIPVVNLGHQALTGVFPEEPDQKITTGPLELVWCPDSSLLQLRHSYDPGELYGFNYGYRSGLNQSMVSHLQKKVEQLQRVRRLKSGDLVVDIGSNDATTLRAYGVAGLRRVGVDPVGEKFRSFYEEGIDLIPDFFSAQVLAKKYPHQRAAIVTSIAMFYDLEDPGAFVADIHNVLADDGIWHFEQSYMPSMLRTNAYDTICHEHLEYYSLAPVKALLERHELTILDVQMNAVNGGSFAITAARRGAPYRCNEAVVGWLLKQEERMGLHTPRPFREFETRVFEHRANLVSLIKSLNADHKTILGYGASTKGNVLLQFCGLTRDDLPAIAEVNTDKFGRFTPGSRIPIISEDEARRMNPDYFFVLPWHFKENILERERDFIARGGKMIFPMPEIEIV